MENHDWSSISGNSSAPFINGQLLPNASHAEAYFNPPGVHPSLPNYLWLEAGTDFGIREDIPPSSSHHSADHLVAQLSNAGITWKTYQEDISGGSCPLSKQGGYTYTHNPVLYFDDIVAGGNDPASAICIAHVRPYTEFASDLQNNAVANYNFIVPNKCHDMHDCGIGSGDAWLSTEVPRILNSQAYQNGGALFITWDEGKAGDGPVGMIVLSPYAKGNGYANSFHYTHASLLRTLQEIFGVRPFLGGAASAADLSDFFSVALTDADAPLKVRNAASYGGGSIVPGEIVSLFGADIGPAAPAGLAINSAGMVATSLGGVRVLFDSTPAPLLYAAPNQVNLVVPFEVAGKATCQMQIDRDGRLSPPLVLAIAQTAPAIFTQDGSGSGPAAVLNQDGRLNSPSRPAAPGSIVSLFATGAGQMDPPGVSGQLAGSSPAQPLQSVSATIAGAPATVMYAGPAPGLVSGVLQVNLKIPDGTPTGDSVPIVLTIGSGSSQAGVTISVGSGS